MIKLDNVTKRYGDNTVIKNFSLDIEDGGRIGIMGRSGEGKTTLVRLICGLEKADNGKIEIDGRISVMFQEDRLFEDMTVYKNILAVTGNSERAEECLKGVEMWQDKDKKIKELSGGMARRVSLARALAFEHDVIILDEPFKGLDIETRERVARFTYNMEKGKTVILITHDPLECNLLGIDNIVSVSK